MITQLTAENVKKLEAVHITPDGKPVILTGQNEAGKSTVLDCIWMALRGEVPAQPIRQGQQKASIKLSIQIDGQDEDITVERTFTSKGSYLAVKDAKGKKQTSPQKLLDGLISSLTLDPLAFSRMKPAEQRETLLRIAGIDLTDWETRHKEAYDNRTLANREAKRKEQAWEGMRDAAEGTPEAEQSANELIAEIEDMRQKQKDRQDAQDEGVKLDNDKADSIIRIKELKAKLAQEEKNLERFEKAIKEHTIPEAPDGEAVAKKRAELDRIEETNREVRRRIAKEEAKDETDQAKKNAETAQKKIDALLKEKAKVLESADFGIPDLFVNDDGVLFEGNPLEQQSSARTIEISTRIAMRDKTKLRLLIIRDASLIGTPIFKRIAEMADAEGYQLWVERFQEEPGEEGIHIVDGTIGYIDGQPVSKEAPEPDDAPEQPDLLGDDDIDL